MTGKWRYLNAILLEEQPPQAHFFTARHQMGFTSLCSGGQPSSFEAVSVAKKCPKCLSLISSWKDNDVQEAIAWFNKDKNNHVVAHGWKAVNEIGLKVVGELYKLGAELVEVSPIAQDLNNPDDIEPGEHVYGFIITLPYDPSGVIETFCYICNVFDRCEEDIETEICTYKVYASWGV